MMGAAREMQRYAFPAEAKRKAILEIFISSGKRKSHLSSRDPSGGVQPDG